MSLSTKKIVVIDTNLFLHYKRPDHFDWAGLHCQNIELVVLAIVIRELEKTKNFGSSTRLRTRAAEMITWLSKVMDQGFDVELRKGLRIRFETNEPAIDFVEHNLVRELQDDVLIAGLISLAKSTPERPLMATADLGVKSKARQRGFEVFAPLETDKLAEELDQRDKELLELRKENQQYKNRQPRLKVAFVSRETRLQVQLPTPQSIIEPAEPDMLKQRYPSLKSAAEIAKLPTAYQLGHALNAVPEWRRERYNAELEQFYEKYEKYRNRVVKLRRMAQCRVELSIIILNEGTAPATDIDVVMKFPEGSFVLKDLKLFEEPKLPAPPEKPISASLGAGFLDSPHLRLPEFRNFTPPPGLFPRPELDWSLEVDGNTAHFRLDRLKPEFDWTMPTLWLQFPNMEDVRSTTVHVDVSAAESLGRNPHQLHIIIS